VNAGDALFVLTSERDSATRGAADQGVTSLLQSRRASWLAEREQMRRQVAQRADSVARKLEQLVQDANRIKVQINLQQRRVALAQEALDRHTHLQTQNFVSSAQVQDKQAEVLDQRQRLADLERVLSSITRDLGNGQADLKDQRIQAQRDQESVARSMASVEQELTENEERRKIVVRAPQSGVVTAMNAELGQTVALNWALASVVPLGTPLIAELVVPSRAVGFVRPGMEVLVRYQAYPYQKFGQHRGRVLEVSSSPLRPEELNVPSVAAVGSLLEPLYRLRVALDHQSVKAYGQDQPLKAGMALDASVLLERRRLLEWVLDPLYTVMGRV
jgi:membrane fusion protein